MHRLGIDCHEGEVYTHRSIEREACIQWTKAIQGSPRASQEAGRVGRKCRQEPLLWFLWEGRREAGLRALGLAHSMIPVGSELWGLLVVWHLDLGWLENLIHLSWWTVFICMEEDGTALKNKTDHVKKLVKRFTQQIFIDHKWHGQWCAMLWGLTGLPTAWTWPLGVYSLVWWKARLPCMERSEWREQDNMGS